MNLEHKKRFISKEFSKTISYTTLNQLKMIIKLLIIRDSGDKIIHLSKNEAKTLFCINGGKTKKLLYYTISNLLREAQITLFPNEINHNTKIIQIINSAVIFENEEVEIEFNSEFIDYFDNIKDNFGTIYYEDVDSIKKSHALKLYLILCAYSGRNNVYKFSVKYTDIKSYFFVDAKKENGRFSYDNGEFKRSLIEPMIEEISLKTSINVLVEYKREQIDFIVKREKYIYNWCNSIRELENISIFNQQKFINKLKETTKYIIGDSLIIQGNISDKIINDYTIKLANMISDYLDKRDYVINRENYFNYILDNIDDIKESEQWRENIYNLMKQNYALASFISKIK